MNEQQACTNIVNTFLDAGHEAFKIPDMPRSKFTKFNRSKGYDITASIHLEAVLIEAKVSKTYSLTPSLKTLRNMFTDSQINRFDRVTRNRNAHCFAFIVCFKSSVYVEKRMHKLYVIPWEDILFSKYDPEKYEARKCKDKRYDLQSFFDSFPRF